MFQSLQRLPADAILGLMGQYRADPAARKVDLGVGVYRDLSGNTPVLGCVRRAEQAILSGQTSKSYIGPAGREEFNTAVQELVLGQANSVALGTRARTVQAPGGCGALRLGAELIRVAAAGATVHVSDPTWGNHMPLLGSSGLRLDRYPYYDATAHQLQFAAMLDRLQKLPQGDVVLIHACCHNPTGADLGMEQWTALADLLDERSLVPILDIAYQGFGTSLDADAAGVRLLAQRLPEVLVAVSFSKNLGLYRERVGALICISENAQRADAVHSHVLQTARSIYSMPPDHGAAIAAHIFADASLRRDWIMELASMRKRITDMRALLSDELQKVTGGDEFDFIREQHGMFSLLGVPAAVVDRLREQHHIYMLRDSRMNLAGLMPDNAAYVAECIAEAVAH